MRQTSRRSFFSVLGAVAASIGLSRRAIASSSPPVADGRWWAKVETETPADLGIDRFFSGEPFRIYQTVLDGAPEIRRFPMQLRASRLMTDRRAGTSYFYACKYDLPEGKRVYLDGRDCTGWTYEFDIDGGWVHGFEVAEWNADGSPARLKVHSAGSYYCRRIGKVEVR